ncbi:hypothetical protein L3556_06345 [Candidatus Synechococcus calcipolaris G9]|uniref:Uncharacterized protein n=1 Tax=Candidatus Synechococcus calcipolaris G9 TaxID=1497997 RepID=A0ABT6EXL5_9SYNE|nr:hypothetical protein [Candidatus Synechococcus calcipolaris]MDG2990555.1 hypothetical protein [Candidatus Synechococcus calcipolaris G9]
MEEILDKEVLLLVRNIKKVADTDGIDYPRFCKRLRDSQTYRNAFLQRYSRRRRPEIAMMLPQALEVIKNDQT